MALAESANRSQPLSGERGQVRGEVAGNVLHLIDRLESLVAEGLRIPLTGRAVIDEREFMDIIDQLRASLPEELRQARRITQERERLLAEGRAEAERIVNMAQEQAAFLLQDTELSKSAERRAQMIVADAQRQAAELLEQARAQAEALTSEAARQAEEARSGADAYARDVLSNLEHELNRHLVIVRKGLTMLDRPLDDVAARKPT